VCLLCICFASFDTMLIIPIYSTRYYHARKNVNKGYLFFSMEIETTTTNLELIKLLVDTARNLSHFASKRQPRIEKMWTGRPIRGGSRGTSKFLLSYTGARRTLNPPLGPSNTFHKVDLVTHLT